MVIGEILMISQKIPAILLFLLFFPVLCRAAEETGAPAKFYDGLPIETAKSDSYYTVKANESLSAIAARYGYNYIKLARWNDIPAPYNVVKGQKLKLFNPSASNIHKNATVKVSFAQLPARNDINSPNQVYAEKKLKVFKNKQKHSLQKPSQKQLKTAKIVRDNPQKTSIISINNKSMLKFYYHWPTEGKIIKNFSQTGGRGIEIRGKAGQAIKAAAAGKVVAVSPGIFGHGGFIVIQHHAQFLSSYANLRLSLVKNGQTVAPGQMIAEMGRVGHKPPSLEFEIRKNGKLVDPLRFLPKKI